MKAKELRIGNYVNPYDDFITQVTGITNTGKIWLVDNPTHEECAWKEEQIKSIPITEEWRLKLGFKRRGISSRIKIGNTGMELCWYDNEKKLRLQTIKSGFTIPLDIKNEVYIIQNLFHALTSKELTLK